MKGLLSLVVSIAGMLIATGGFVAALMNLFSPVDRGNLTTPAALMFLQIFAGGIALFILGQRIGSKPKRPSKKSVEDEAPLVDGVPSSLELPLSSGDTLIVRSGEDLRDTIAGLPKSIFIVFPKEAVASGNPIAVKAVQVAGSIGRLQTPEE